MPYLVPMLLCRACKQISNAAKPVICCSGDIKDRYILLAKIRSSTNTYSGREKIQIYY